MIQIDLKKTSLRIRLKLISNISQLHNPRHGIWNNPVCLVCQCIILSEFTQWEKTTKPKTKHASTPNTNERKWQQPQLQLLLVTKSRGKQELGLPSLSAAVHPQKMMPRSMLQSIQIFVNDKFTKCFDFFCACIDLLFILFIC